MGLMQKKDNTMSVEACVDACNLILENNVDLMVTLDTLTTLLIQRSVFTKGEFDELKEIIKSTPQYKEISSMTKNISKALDETVMGSRVTEEELRDLAKCLSPGEVDPEVYKELLDYTKSSEEESG